MCVVLHVDPFNEIHTPVGQEYVSLELLPICDLRVVVSC